MRLKESEGWRDRQSDSGVPMRRKLLEMHRNHGVGIDFPPKMLNGALRQFCSHLQISGCHQLTTA